MKLTKTKISLVLGISLLVVACGAATIIGTLETIASFGVQVAESAGALTPQQAAYFDAGLQCAEAASAELATMDTAADKAFKIGNACAAAGSQFIPAGLPANLLALATNQAKEVQSLINSLPKTTSSAAGQRQFADAFLESRPVSVAPTAKQKAQLKKIQDKAQKARAKLRSRKQK